MKNILLTILCAAFLMSCASQKAAMMDPSITEAKVLQAMAKEKGLEVPAAEFLLTSAEKEKKDGNKTKAFFLADEAILQFQIALLERENKSLSDSLKAVNESLNVYRTALDDRRKRR